MTFSGNRLRSSRKLRSPWGSKEGDLDLPSRSVLGWVWFWLGCVLWNPKGTTLEGRGYVQCLRTRMTHTLPLQGVLAMAHMTSLSTGVLIRRGLLLGVDTRPLILGNSHMAAPSKMDSLSGAAVDPRLAVKWESTMIPKWKRAHRRPDGTARPSKESKTRKESSL